MPFYEEIPVKLLVVNADDFGFTRDVNQGIVEAHQGGILTAATLMANGEAFGHAVQLAREHPTLDVGCHLVLVGGRSLAEPARALPAGLASLMAAVAARRLRVYDELKAQIHRILDAGLEPSHLDTHKHTHLLPPVLDAVARLSEEFRIRWVRRPFPLRLFRRRFHDVLARHGCRTTDHFAGFLMTGRFHTRQLVRLIAGLSEGTTEFMCHPGHCGADLASARTRLKQSRERELEALTAAETRAALEASGVRLASFRDLALATGDERE